MKSDVVPQSDTFLADDRIAMLAAVSEREVVGLAEVALMDSPEVPILVQRRYASVDTVVVSDQHQEKASGGQLMNAVAMGGNEGAMEVELTVYEFNSAAIGFYEALGYSCLRRRMSKRLVSE